MSQDTEMSINYRLVLNDLERRLAGMDAQRRALEASIAGVKAYLASMDGEEPELPLTSPNGNGQQGKPPIPPFFFAGKSPTVAYRDLVRLWPADYTPPQIADAFQAGGMEKPRTELLQAIHSVIKRERERKRRNGHQLTMDE